jgi:predicted nucleotidyltransferase
VKTPALRERDLAVLRGVFLRFPCVSEVRLFGSRATGHARRASDIDLAISAPAATAGEWLALTEALESAPLIYELDVVRTERTDNPRLLEKLTREGVPIYPESARV